MTYKQRGHFGLGCLVLGSASLIGAVFTSEFKEKAPRAGQNVIAATQGYEDLEKDRVPVNPIAGSLLMGGLAFYIVGFAKIMEEEPQTIEVKVPKELMPARQITEPLLDTVAIEFVTQVPELVDA